MPWWSEEGSGTSLSSFEKDQVCVRGWGGESSLITLPCEVVSSQLLGGSPTKAEETLGKLRQEFLHGGEGWRS